ncbi:hypothetical protein Pmani_035294 [Petrolisthes manimaculis]|uniref:Fibrinogen C-terminal domain-containing protein n=1 Tax=Petrolisthes manimaculis TaxID=1843537 RepID=A0AAE1TQN5_9EUCA|nr:hypothetical protein Pmani_035294 [Petrolisthes manimaculis]KAK4291905.1 hypothetical protein Pmani_035294 [Petrolisthes manimaculis]
MGGVAVVWVAVVGVVVGVGGAAVTTTHKSNASVEALQEDKTELRQQLQEYKKRLRNVQYARLTGKSTTTSTTTTKTSDDRCHCEREGGGGGGGEKVDVVVVEKVDEPTDILKCPCLDETITTTTTIPTTTTTTTTTAASAIGSGSGGGGDVVATTTTTRPTRPTTTTTTETPVLGGGARVKDCAGHQNEGAIESGVYEIFPSECRAKKVWCDLETEGGGWTVFLQRRELPQQENFTRTWLDYERGFGEVVGEYWLGNEALHQLTAKAPHVLRVDAEDFLGSRRWGHWGRFRVASPQKNYELLAVAYATNSTLGDGLLWHSGMKFSTIDRDNDNHKGSCADEYKGGWWYNVCHNANPTGILNNSENFDSVGWVYWTPRLYKWASLRNLQMKFRPSGFGATIPSSAPGDCTTTTTTSSTTTTPKPV